MKKIEKNENEKENRMERKIWLTNMPFVNPFYNGPLSYATAQCACGSTSIEITHERDEPKATFYCYECGNKEVVEGFDVSKERSKVLEKYPPVGEKLMEDEIEKSQYSIAPFDSEGYFQRKDHCGDYVETFIKKGFFVRNKEHGTYHVLAHIKYHLDDECCSYPQITEGLFLFDSYESFKENDFPIEIKEGYEDGYYDSEKNYDSVKKISHEMADIIKKYEKIEEIEISL